MKCFKNNRGYSMIEIGIGLLIIAIFSTFSIGLFNGCYNNHHAIQSRNNALKYGISKMESILQSNDFAALGFNNSMIDRSSILAASNSANEADRLDGKYAVPDDKTEDVDKNIRVTTKYRRVPTSSANEAYDNTVLKVSVIVEYKIRTNDADYRTLELNSVKVTK